MLIGTDVDDADDEGTTDTLEILTDDEAELIVLDTNDL